MNEKIKKAKEKLESVIVIKSEDGSKKLDIKNILIIILFVGCGLFFTNYMLGGSNNRKEIKRLKEEVNDIQKKRDKLDVDFKDLESNFKRDSLELIVLKKEFALLDRKIKDKDKEIAKAKKDLNDLKKSLEGTKKEIEKLKSNPVKRTGNELLNSIKEKTK